MNPPLLQGRIAFDPAIHVNYVFTLDLLTLLIRNIFLLKSIGMRPIFDYHSIPVDPRLHN